GSLRPFSFNVWLRLARLFARGGISPGERTHRHLRATVFAKRSRLDFRRRCSAVLWHRGASRMNLNLTGKVVVISGGAKGIGGAISLACAAEGAVPVMLDRDSGALGQIEEKLSEAGHRYGAFQCELTETTQCERAIQSAKENFGK